MTIHYRLDRDSFEALLANAFAVQKSGLDKQSLAKLVEIHKFVASDQFDFGEAMRMVANRVLTLSKADGVAIALLDVNQLVYYAGVGSATKEIGRRVAAVLNVSPSRDLRHEILRVEDVSKDTRIEADICRQFGARSLLMLPIFKNGALKGILQITFDAPHSFIDQEIRVYRLMASALEEGILRQQPMVEKRDNPAFVTPMCNMEGKSRRGLDSAEASVTSSTVPDPIDLDAFQAHVPTNPGKHLVMEQANEYQDYLTLTHRGRSRPWAVLRAVASWPVRWSSTSLLRCFCVTLGATIVLTLTLCMSRGNHHISSIGSSTTPPLPSNRARTEGRPSPAIQGLHLRSSARETPRTIPGFTRVRISANEVDYIAEDVTIRRFTSRPMQPELQRVVKEFTLGDDVTVRYFASSVSAVFKPTAFASGKNAKLQQRQ